MGEAAGAIRPYAASMAGNLFRLSQKRVRDVMVPRARVLAVPRTIDPEALLDLLREEGFTRIPVYDGDLDRIVGVLHTKDLFHLYAKQRVVALADATRPHVEVKPDGSLADTMRLLRQGRSVADIKDYVDTAYAKYGLSNMP